jgi:uncharacterized protein
MLLGELDGYLTAIALCPVPIAPGEWLPPIWGGHYGEVAPFEEPLDAPLFAEMVQARHGEILRELGRGKPQPIFDVDEHSRELLWDVWADGFAQAMALRPDDWSAFEGTDAAAAMAELRTLIAVATEESPLTSVEINVLHDTAPAAIPRYLLQLHAVVRNDAPPVAQASAKIGRNAPCPCGSGKKHKRCCGSD